MDSTKRAGPHSMGRHQRESTRKALRKALPDLARSGQLLLSDEELVVYECDGLAAYRQAPIAVALPATTQQVQSVVIACGQLAVPIVPWGAGTGLSGGA